MINPLQRAYLFALEEKNVQRRNWFQATIFITLLEISFPKQFLVYKTLGALPIYI